MTDTSSRPSSASINFRNNSFDSDNNDRDRDSSLTPSEDHEDEEIVSPPPRPTGTLRVLARGNACLCCRRRKLKCDGAKPACGPCTRGRRMNECVYEETKIKTKTQILQSRIRELEAKIRKMAEKEKELQPQQPQPQHHQESLSLTNVPLSTSPEPSLLGARLRSNSHSGSGTVDSIFASSSASIDVDAIFAHRPPTQDGTTSAFDSLTGSSFSSDFNPYVAQHTLTPERSPEHPWARASMSDSDTWLSTMPMPVPNSYTLGSAPFPASSTTVAPSSMGLLMPTGLENSISSPSLSSAMTHTSTSATAVSSTASSPPPVSWEHDLRLSASDLSRQMDMDDVPMAIAQELLTVFLSHRRQCGFEVHVGRFIASLALPASQRPHPALINAVYLLGCHFSENAQLSQYEALFLSRTRRGINHSLENADRLLDFLHASCLLAWYFFFKGRLLEGHYHASAAARFAISCRLHVVKVRPRADVSSGTMTFFNASPITPGERNFLGPAEDAVALSERINLFWSIFLADRTGSIGTGLPVVIRDEDVEATWPSRFEDLELPDFVRPESNSIRSLYEPGNAGAHVKMTDSLHAMRCKALALNERASRVASILEADPHAVHNPDFWPQFDSIDAAIQRFIETLPPLISSIHDGFDASTWEDEGAFDKSGQKSVASPSIVLAYTAAFGATIQLHRMFGSNDAASYRRCLKAATAAMRVVNHVNSMQVKYLPMTLGIIWTSVAEVLAVEHERLRRIEAQAQLEETETQLTALFQIMRDLRSVFPILTLRINKVPIFLGCSAELDAGIMPTCCAKI